jgi:transcriptional regulator with XRE-family HTH domain
MTPARLRALRQRAGLSQPELAELVGLRAETICRMEAGRVPMSRRPVTVALLAAFEEAARSEQDLASRLRAESTLLGRLRVLLSAGR